MTDGEALFRAILDDPDDDLPRLAYADWLEENGRQPRAQLIRLMCEAARLAPSREPAARRRFEEATAEYCSLLARHEAEWLAELPRLDGLEWGMAGEKARFHRGFAHAITVSGPGPMTLRITGNRALETSPVEWLRVEGHTDGRLGKWPGLARISRLDLTRNVSQSEDWAFQLAASTHVRRLRWLQFGGAGLTWDQVLALLLAPWFGTVERLEARGAAYAAIPQAPLQPYPRLRYLDLSDSDLTPDLLGCLSESTFPNLARLHLAGCDLGDSGVGLLASTEAVRPLRHLDLSRNGISAHGALALATTPLLDNLQFLDLRLNPIPPSHRRRLRDRFDHDECRLLIDGEGQP